MPDAGVPGTMLSILCATAAANGVLFRAVERATGRTRFYARLSAAQRVDLDSRLVGLVNVAACLGSALALWAAPDTARAWRDPHEAVFGASPARARALALLGGFLLYDGVLIVARRAAFGGVDWSMLLHHAIILGAVGLAVGAGRCTFHICCLLVNEVRARAAISSRSASRALTRPSDFR